MRHFLFGIGMVIFIFPALLSASEKKGSKILSGPLSEEALRVELTGRDESKMSDVDLYAEIVAAYQSHDEVGLRTRLQKFMVRHAKSPFADNALYLAGRQALDKKNYSEAIKYFHRVVSEYPRSNRVVSSQFAKAMAYKKMNLEPQARRVFRDIMRKYPGSPESFRADSEMRLLN